MRQDLLDIIHLEHHISEKHPQMSRSARAAQFAPFAALRGLEDERAEVEETLQHVLRRELSEESMAELEEQFQRVKKGITVEMRYYRDGLYRKIIGKVDRFDPIERVVRVKNEGNDITAAFENIDEIVVKE